MGKIRLIHIGTCTLNGLNNILRNKKDHRDEPYYDGKYSEYIKISGNFYGSLSYISSLLNSRFDAIKRMKEGDLYGYNSYSNSSYHLLKNNCMQVSVDALSVGYFYSYENTYKKALEFTRLYTVPNEAYDFMKSTVRCTQMYGNNSYNMIAKFLKTSILKKAQKMGIW